MVTRNTYFQALREVVRACKADNIVSQNIQFIALLGSVREKEEIPGSSDLDILCVISSDKYGCVDKIVVAKIREICTVASKHRKIRISLLTHTVHDLETYVDYEYLRHYSHGEVVFGSPKVFSQLFRRVVKKKKETGSALKQFMLNNILHTRFNLIRRFVSLNRYNTDHVWRVIAKLFVDDVLKVADWRLIAMDIWSESKKEIASMCLKKIKGDYGDVPYRAYTLRKRLGTGRISPEDLEVFCYDSLNFIDECVKQLS